MKITTSATYVEYWNAELNLEDNTFKVQKGLVEIRGRLSMKKINNAIPKNATVTGVFRETLEYASREDFLNDNPCDGGRREIEIENNI